MQKVVADVVTTPVNIFTPSLLPSGYLPGQSAANRRPEEAVFGSLYCHLPREVTGLAVNFVGLLIAALFLCTFEIHNYWY